MQRGLAALTAVGALGVVALLPGSAYAATNQLTVVTLARDGAPLAVNVSVFNLADNSMYSLTSGKPTALPKGTYAALTDIYNISDGTDTIGASVVTVSGITGTTIDARAGLPIQISLNPGLAPETQVLSASVCTTNFTGSSAGGWNTAGKLFVIPNSSPSLLFGVASKWSLPAASGPAAAYLVAAGTRGLPGGYSQTVDRSALASVAIDVRRGPAGSPTTGLAVQPGGQGCQTSVYGELASQDAPYQRQVYLSAGSWHVGAQTYAAPGVIGGQYKDLTVAGGQNYGLSFFNSAWAPAGSLPYVTQKSLRFYAAGMFTDPWFFGSGSGEASSKFVMTLKKSGKVLKRKSGTEFGTSVDAALFRYRLRSKGWYTLSVDASRYYPGLTYPADMLSTRTTASFRFLADPKKNHVARVFLVRIFPQGLNLSNQAAPLSVTTVALGLNRPKQGPDSKLTSVRVKSLTAQASYDNGNSWHTVQVTSPNGHWSAAVPNPASGTVSLRVTVVSSTGDSSVITVYKAYAIG